MRDIVLECNPDEVLIKTLGFPRKKITHQPSRGEVINYLKKNPNAIGIVDDDPGSAKPSYFSKFQIETKENFNVESYCIPKLQTRLIIIKPRLEEWILKRAAESGIDTGQYSLPNNGHELHKIIINRLPRFEAMIKAMLDKNNAALLHLKNLIKKKPE